MFAVRFILPALFFGLAIAVSTGLAANAAEETASIEGKITLDGKPVTKGKVSFHPEKGKPTEAKIKKDGAFSADKVPVGALTITVTGKGVPAKFGDPKTSPLRYDAKKGQQALDLDLKE